MQRFLTTVKRFVKSEDGPTATEYAVMLALIIVAAIAAITLLGGRVTAMFAETTTALGG
jgi:pilus assembly protein Flp/PilA